MQLSIPVKLGIPVKLVTPFQVSASKQASASVQVIFLYYYYVICLLKVSNLGMSFNLPLTVNEFFKED